MTKYLGETGLNSLISAIKILIPSAGSAPTNGMGYITGDTLQELATYFETNSDEDITFKG